MSDTKKMITFIDENMEDYARESYAIAGSTPELVASRLKHYVLNDQASNVPEDVHVGNVDWRAVAEHYQPAE